MEKQIKLSEMERELLENMLQKKLVELIGLHADNSGKWDGKSKEEYKKFKNMVMELKGKISSK